MTDAPSAPASAPVEKPSRSGCLPAAVILVLILVVGVIWNALSGSDSHTKNVTRSDYSTAWPLTVDAATIGCANGKDPYVQVGSTRYALNGTEAGYEPISSIWADDPASPGLKVDIAPLRSAALALC